MWYCLDFTPSVNASAQSKYELGQIDLETLELLLIDESLGAVGFGLASMIWLGAFLYTKQLVSAIWASQNSGEEETHLSVSALKLPFLTQPTILGRTVFDPESNAFSGEEDIVFTESEIRSEPSVEIFAPGELSLSEESKKNDVITKFDGDFSKLKGHTALKREDAGGEGSLAKLLQNKYLLDIDSESEIMPNAGPILLRSLVLEDYHFKGSQQKGGRYESKKLNSKGVKNGGTDEGEPSRSTNIGKSIKRKKGYRSKRRR